MVQPTLYARLGQLVANALCDRLSAVESIATREGVQFAIAVENRPSIYNGSWSFQLTATLPDTQLATLTFRVGQVGSCISETDVHFQLPEPDFVDDLLVRFPPQHAEEYWSILDAVIELVQRRGFRHATDGDFYVYENYLPSETVSVSLLNIAIASHDVIGEIHKLLQGRKYRFCVALNLELPCPPYGGKEECLIVRPDRVSEDWDVERLRSEFGDQFAW